MFVQRNIASIRKFGVSSSYTCRCRFTHSEAEWEDVKQRKEIKPIEFYDSHALKRQYFYHVNLFGHLFIEDVLPKNITSCLKNNKFLDFFFSQIKPNDTGMHLDYPFVSPCGKEMNFIKTADPYGAVVLREFDMKKREFQYAGSKVQLLNPASFVISSKGRLYHELTQHRHSEVLGNLALIRSQVALELCENNVEFGEGETHFIWEGKKYRMRPFEELELSVK
jgi:hypothetical protein